MTGRSDIFVDVIAVVARGEERVLNSVVVLVVSTLTEFTRRDVELIAKQFDIRSHLLVEISNLTRKSIASFGGEKDLTSRCSLLALNYAWSYTLSFRNIQFGW